MLLLDNQTLFWKSLPLLTALTAETLPNEGAKNESFLRFTAEKAAARHVFPLGELSSVLRFMACHRYEPYWMKPCAGEQGGDVPVETQVLFCELAGGDVALFVPLLDGGFRASVQGTGENGLELVIESGDPAFVGKEFTGLYVAAGPDVYTLIRESAKAVMAHLGTGRLREEKELPAFVDYFGWCTWDAFYQDVSHEKVLEGLASFQEGGLPPKYLILDDGWQSERKMETGERRLTGFAANAKFPGDLKPTITAAKEQFGIENFFVWHTLNGYWGGVDGQALPGYGVRDTARDFSPGILHHHPDFNTWFGGFVGVVPPENTYKFFQDYHRHLRSQGVDGVKTDSQSTIEGVCRGYGTGRVGAMRAYHEALEGAAQTHFQGNLINCMSCASEMLYSALASNLTRTSTDFWPTRPESHGLHVYTNALVSLWFGEFVHPDWDMFQSGHPMGAYHAAARAVGGCPVYVSDKPAAHDFDLLRKLVLKDGQILRADLPGRPTRDCLFHDPTREAVLLKIFTYNTLYGYLVGAFNARYAEDGTEPLAGVVRPSDVAGILGDFRESGWTAEAVAKMQKRRFAVYAHRAKELRVLEFVEGWEISLPQLEWELFTVIPIEDAVMPVGLVNLFNSAAAVTFQGFDTEGSYRVGLVGGGDFAAYCEPTPVRVLCEAAELPFVYDPAAKRLSVPVPDDTPAPELRIVFA